MFDMRFIDEFRAKVHSDGEIPTRRTTLILIDRIKELEAQLREADAIFKALSNDGSKATLETWDRIETFEEVRKATR